MSPKDAPLLDNRIHELDIKLLIILEKIKSLSEEALTIERERAALLQAKKNLINSSGVDSPSSFSTTVLDRNIVNRVARTRLRGANIVPGSIKEAALQALSQAPEGLMALDILKVINQARERPVSRTSLSPQLSRLGQAELVTQDNSLWHVTAKGKAALQAAMEPSPPTK